MQSPRVAGQAAGTPHAGASTGMKYEVHQEGHRLEAIGAHSGWRIRMSTMAALDLQSWPVTVHVRGSESEDEIKVGVPRRHLGSATEAFDFGYHCATLWIDALGHRRD